MKHSARICDQTAVLWSCDTIVLFSNIVLQIQTVKSNIKRFFAEPSIHQSSITGIRNRDSNKSIQVFKELSLTNTHLPSTDRIILKLFSQRIIQNLINIWTKDMTRTDSTCPFYCN